SATYRQSSAVLFPLPLKRGEGQGEGSVSPAASNPTAIPPLPFPRGEGRGEGSVHAPASAASLPLPFRRGEGRGEGSVPLAKTPLAAHNHGSAPTLPSETDADNHYLWRMNRARLDAESIRDSILFISGKLDLTMGGPGVQQFYFKDDHSPVYDYTLFDLDSPASSRRSIYRFIVRSVPDPLMESLDCPDASILAPKRSATMTSLQALAILNDPFVLKQSEHFAERVAKARGLRKQIEQVYGLALNR